ncbi:hypothetical protein BDFB_013332 [Asbolus verrucosus]|uniref:Uncharacterized protein n=1 Tax=Asbolus verrucosus TaxID=1661398 RepID=A0A482VSJ0_ASBVE|nr:hypothetical protein BDFB_013332 [Asbolus verrucosus]
MLAIESLLPAKSKEKYENAYRQFDDWYKEKQMKEIKEEMLLAYFQQKSKAYKSSTLWSIYSMMRTLFVKKNICIKKFVSVIEHVQFK